MRVMHKITRLGICVCLAFVTPVVIFAQAELAGNPLTGPAVSEAPFSAQATTTVRQTLRDGTLVERIGIAHYYRDRVGRVRVEHMVTGLDPLNSATKGQV